MGADTVKKICDIYDWDGKGELDLFFLGDIMYAMGYNTTKKVCVGLGQTDEEGKKFAKFDDVVSKVEEALKTPDSQEHAKGASARHFVKVMSHVAGDVAEEDVQVVVTVGSALFVVETDGVAQFVGDNSGVSASTGLKGHLVRTMVVSNAGVTSPAAEDGDVVVVPGGASFSAAGLHKSDASLSHPHLHTSVDRIELAGRESSGDFVRDDSFGPSVPVAGHSCAGKSLQFSVFDFVLGRVHVHVHVEVDFLVLTGGLGGSSGGSSGGNDLVNSPVIVTVFDGEFSVQDFICAESFLELHLFSRDEAESQEGNEKVGESHCKVV